MRVGGSPGTGTYTLPGAGEARTETVVTRHGDVIVSRLDIGGVEALHLSRHEEGHRRLSNHVAHLANIAALQQLGAEAVVAVTVWGAGGAAVALRSLCCAAGHRLPTS